MVECRKALAVLPLCLLLACGAPPGPMPRTIAEKARQPAPVLEQHPECVGSTELGPVLNVGCREHCLPPRIMDRVCNENGEVVYVPSSKPVTEPQPYGRVLRENGCWEILQLEPQGTHYTDEEFSWASFPPAGQPCGAPAKYPQVWGWFGRNYGKLDFHAGTHAMLSEF